jgi:Protein of unknown function (DUF2752)
MSADPTRNSETGERSRPALPIDHDPRQAYDSRGHWVILGLSLAVALGGFLVDVNSDGSIYVRGLPEYPFPVVCPLRRFFGISCPTCGMTRSIVFLLQGRLADSVAVHRLGWLMFAVIAAQIPYRVWCLAKRRIVPYRPRLTEWTAVAFTLLLVLNWLFS